MLYVLAADAVLLLHLAFVLFVVLGGFLVLRWHGLAWLHVPAAVWGAAIELGGWVCPLTPLEVGLRQAAGQNGYTGDFVEHYITALLYPQGLTREIQFALGAFVIVLNAAVYLVLWRRIRRGA